MNVELLRKEDTDQAINLLSTLFGEQYRETITVDINAAFLHNQWITPEYHIIKDQGRVVSILGIADAVIDFNVYSIYWVGVLEKYRGRGYCRALVEYVLGLKKSPGRVLLNCRDELVPMYSKFGFKLISSVNGKNIMLYIA